MAERWPKLMWTEPRLGATCEKVVPAEWWENRTDLARELHEALSMAVEPDGNDPRIEAAFLRYEQEVGECPTCGSDDPEVHKISNLPKPYPADKLCLNPWHEQEVGE